MKKEIKYRQFQFKQFSLAHEKSGMKIGTDAVILGAWSPFRSPKTILDIGTGTGILALMMAQRFSQAKVLAIEPEPEAFQEASQNFCNSIFSERISVMNCALQEVAQENLFDAIVCNPPFFEESLNAPEEKRNLARHTVSLPFDELFRCVSILLSKNGEFSLVIPSDMKNRVLEIAAESNLFPVFICKVKDRPETKPVRHLVLFTGESKEAIEQELVLKNPDQTYSEVYRSLTSAFHPHF